LLKRLTITLEPHLINSVASQVLVKLEQNYVKVCRKGPSTNLMCSQMQLKIKKRQRNFSVKWTFTQ